MVTLIEVLVGIGIAALFIYLMAGVIVPYVRKKTQLQGSFTKSPPSTVSTPVEVTYTETIGIGRLPPNINVRFDLTGAGQGAQFQGGGRTITVPVDGITGQASVIIEAVNDKGDTLTATVLYDNNSITDSDTPTFETLKK